MTPILPPRFVDIKGWAGSCPVIRIGDDYYSVKERRGDLWLCFRKSLDTGRQFWFTADDNEYYFDKDGNLERVENG